MLFCTFFYFLFFLNALFGFGFCVCVFVLCCYFPFFSSLWLLFTLHDLNVQVLTIMTDKKIFQLFKLESY